MISSTLIEVFGHTVISFTRGVTEQFDSEEPEFTAESLGYDPLESTGPQEWNYRPFDEFIFQEYSERGNTAWVLLSAIENSCCKSYERVFTGGKRRSAR